MCFPLSQQVQLWLDFTGLVYNAKHTIILTLASASISIGVDIGLHHYPNVTGLNILFVFSSFSTDAIVTRFYQIGVQCQTYYHLDLSIGFHQYRCWHWLASLYKCHRLKNFVCVFLFLNRCDRDWIFKLFKWPKVKLLLYSSNNWISTQNKSPIKLAQLSKLSYKNRIAVYTRPSSYYLLPVKQLHSKERKLFDLIFHNWVFVIFYSFFFLWFVKEL